MSGEYSSKNGVIRNGNVIKLIMWSMGGMGAILAFLATLTIQMMGNRFTSADALQMRQQIVEEHRELRREFHDEMTQLRNLVETLILEERRRAASN